MKDNVVVPLQEVEVARLVKFIREQEENEYFALLCANISSEFSRIARYVSKVGFVLSDEWKSADHLVLNVREHNSRLLAVHIRANGNPEDQCVEVSHTVLRCRETKPMTFSLPEQFEDATIQIMAELFSAFPKERLMVKVAKNEAVTSKVRAAKRGEAVPLFEELIIHAQPTWDEAVIKERAVAQVAQDGLGRMIRSPYADDNLPIRSFARR